jgi:hypothetical protein
MEILEMKELLKQTLDTLDHMSYQGRETRPEELAQTSHDTKRPWVGLTDEEANLLWESTDDRDSWELIKRVEAKLKERNT